MSIDGIIKGQIEDACRFLQPGDAFEATVNEHAIVVVKLSANSSVHSKGYGFVVLCNTCKAVLFVDARKPYMAIHKHIEANVIRPDEDEPAK